MFKGHQLIKLINNNWLLDITEYIGYNVKLDSNGEIKSYRTAFIAKFENGNVLFDKKCTLPLKVLKEAERQILLYQNSMVDKHGRDRESTSAV